MVTTTDERFSGSKAAILIGERLLITLRDDRPDIPCPNMWDLVGGGAEPGETPWACLCRESFEEVGLDLSDAKTLWERRYEAVHSSGWVMFYVVQLPARAERHIVFGDEGQGWRLVTPEAYLTMADAVPSLPPRLRDWMASG